MRNSYHSFIQFCLVTILSLLLNKGFAQNDLWLTSTVPTSVIVCDSAKTFSLSVVNGAGLPASAISVTLHLENGQKYVVGSIVGTGVTESNMTDLQNPIFSVSNFSSGNRPFSVKIASSCDLIAATGVSGGQTLQLEADLNYTTNSVARSYHHTSLDYSKKYAALSITNVSNKNYSGNLGNTYTRVITIKNGGYGRVGSFTFTTVHTPVTTISAVTGTATWSSNALTGTETYTVTNFTGVGNGDNYFDLNESINITETVVVNQCATPPTTTQFTVSWGCNNQTCQSSIESASTAISARMPIITLTATGVVPILCDAVSYTQQIRIQNTGTGAAKDFDVEIFRGTDEVGIVAKSDWAAFIDPNTISVKIGNGAFTTVAPAQVYATSSSNSCYGNTKVYKVRVRIANIPASTAVLINFDVQNGCPASCATTNTYGSAGWMYNASYKDECGTTYTKAPAVGLSSKGIKIELAADGTIDLPPSTPSDYTFNVTSYSNNLPSNNTGYWEARYTLSPNLMWTNASTNVTLVSSSGGNVTPVSGSLSYNSSTNVVSIRYSQSLATLNKYNFNLKNVSLDCAVSSASTYIQFELIFHPATACSASLHHTFCSTMNIVPHCPVPCAEGMRFDGFTLARANYGLPDNTNDGLPDNTGVLNMTKVKTRYAMQGDTLKATFRGTAFVATSNFDYAYASTDMKGGANYLSALPATLTINRGGTLYACSVTATKTGNTFGYDISPAVLNGTGTLPTGFQIQNSDDITLETYYVVNQNPGSLNSPFTEYVVTNTFYCSTSPIVNGVSSAPLSCDSYTGKYFLLRHYSYSNGNRTYSLTNCNNLVEQTDLYLGLGTCCSNFEGGNLFANEYRPLSYYNYIDYLVPTGYSFVSAQLKYYYGHGTNMGSSSVANIQSISPTNPGASNLHFDLAALFTAGTLIVGDEGHHMEMYVTIKPDCGVLNGVSSSRFIASMSPIPGAPVVISYADTNINQITYTPSNFLLSSTKSYEVSLQKDIDWEFDLVDLNANSTYPNAFVSFQSPTGKLTVTTLKDVTTNTVINPINTGIYPLGQLSAGHHYQVFVNNAGCGLDSLIIKSGWTCSATYPNSMTSYSCTPNKLSMYVMKDANSSEVQILDGTTDNVMEMCTDNLFRVKLLSSKIAYVYEPELSAILPVGMTYITNSAQILYPLKDSLLAGGGWRTMDDPVLTSATTGQTAKWILNNSVQEPRFLQRGFPGVMNEDSAEVWIRFRTMVSCDFVGGSVVRYRATGKNLCGQQLPTIFDASSKNKINGMSNGYVADMLTRLTASPNMCATPKVNVHVAFYNDSPTPTGSNDYYACTIPAGYSYAGNFQVIRNTGNSFPTTVPVQTTLGSGDTKLEWQLPSGFLGTAYMDSIVFAFDVNVPMSVTDCGQATLASRVTTKGNASCATAPGGSCTVDVQNASASGDFDITRPIYVISNPNFIKGSTDIKLNFTLQNIGSVNATLPVTIELYEDNDNSGGQSAGDNLLTSFVVSTPIAAGSSIGVSKYMVVASSALSFFIKIQPYDVTSTNCTCTPAFVWDDATSALPVQNAHLMGLAGVKNNLLSLTITEGLNIHSFSLEKLLKNGEWKMVSKTISEEASFDEKRIIWQDTLPEMQETYRAAIENIDGSIVYANLVELSRENVEAIVRVYPNPANEELNLAISIPAMDMAHIQVMNDAGIMKVDSWQDLSQGLSIVTLDAAKWATGVYFVKVQYGSVVKTHKVVILHP